MMPGGAVGGPPGAGECGDLRPDSELRLRLEALEAVERLDAPTGPALGTRREDDDGLCNRRGALTPLMLSNGDAAAPTAAAALLLLPAASPLIGAGGAARLEPMGAIMAPDVLRARPWMTFGGVAPRRAEDVGVVMCVALLYNKATPAPNSNQNFWL